MENILLINKPRGYTPLQIVTQLRQIASQYQDKTISYAGRLDPMAEGLLLLLIGDENKRREKYENLEKEYIFEVLFGIATDTYDMMGMMTKQSSPSIEELEQKLPILLSNFLGTTKQHYPPFSSFHIKGKPLFYYAREKKLAEITIPTKEITITKLTLSSLKEIAAKTLIATSISDIAKVKGEFRQEKIVEQWKEFAKNPTTSFPVATISIRCSSGTYVRSIAHTLGELLGCGALAYTIKRTAIGDYKLSDALSFEDIREGLV